ncbi:hypothetical protein Nepgr_007673 [Nepenthes gracilis]|uniref:Uncharacterized protein n=1 Tax=Nepenthes gracilis TaxID=150966 RepID=A0AAD3XII4_NEPGR|nr:hypothetical protein Nepgr_007673 [Nepenthes gracilis]
MNSRASEESGQKPGCQGHGWGSGKGSGKGSSSSLNRSHGTGHGRNTVARKENGVVANRERVFKPSPKPVAAEAGAKVLPHAGRSTSVCVDGSEMVPKSSSSAAECVQHSVAGYTNPPKDVTDAGATKSTSSLHTKTKMDQAPSAVDPVPVQPRGSKRVIMVGTIKCEIGSLRAAALGPRIDVEQYPATTKLPEARSGSETAIALVKETANSTLKQEKLEFPDGQQVIRPDQIQVPEAVKSILHFGTIETSYLSDPKSNKNSSHTAYSLHVETTVVPQTSSRSVTDYYYVKCVLSKCEVLLLFPYAITLSLAIVGCRNEQLHQLRIGTIDASCMNNSESNKTSNHTGDSLDVKTIEKPISRSVTCHFCNVEIFSLFPYVFALSLVVIGCSNQLLQLRFGTFDPSCFNNSESKKIKNYSANLLDNETVEVPKPSTSNKKSPATAKEGSPDQAQDLSHVQEQVLQTESKAPYNDQLKNAKFPTVSPSSSVVHPTPLSVSTSGCSNKECPPTTEEENNPVHPQAPSHLHEQVLSLESKVMNKDQMKREKLPGTTPSYPVTQPTPVLIPSPVNKECLPAAEKGNHIVRPQAPSRVHEQELLSDNKVSNKDQIKQVNFPMTAPKYPVVQSSPMPRSPPLQLEGLRHQGQLLGSSSMDLGTAINYLQNSESNENSNHHFDPLDEESIGVPCLSNQDAPSTIEEANHPNNPPAPSHVQEQVLPIESEISNKDQLRNEKLPTVAAPLYSVVQPTPTPRSSLLQHERLQPQVWISSPNSSSSPSSSFMHGNAPAASTSAPTSPSTQSAMAQGSIDVPVLIFWEPYPLLNYTPCSHYYSPLEVQPTLDPFFGYSGLPQLQSTGNTFVTPPSTTMGMQLPLALPTMEINTGNQAHGGPSFWIPTNYSNWPRNIQLAS